MKTIIYNGKIYLEKGAFASAICIENGFVTHVGTDAEIFAISSENRKISEGLEQGKDVEKGEEIQKIDAQGKAVVPGFNDSHIHLYSVGMNLQSVQLYGASSISQIIELGKSFIAKNNVPLGTFVTGRGWNQTYFEEEKRLITRHDLDKISTQHPIVFTRVCGHMIVCNTKALEVCGITKDTPQIEGAKFYYDEDGTPNGIFAELAIEMIISKIPKPTMEEIAITLNLAMEYALSQGITSIQTNDVYNDNYTDMIPAYEMVYAQSRLKPRTYHQCFFSTVEHFKNFLNDGHRTGQGSSFNKIGALKMFVDGSLGSRTALLKNPYADDILTSGIACLMQEQLNEMVKLADDNRCQVAIHAIGDKAIEMVLDTYDTVIENGDNKYRHGIVHCQITDKPLVERFLENDIIAYVQPIFLHSDIQIVADRVGEQLASTSYAFGDMYRMGVKLCYGTDAPAEDLKTMENIYCAVTRKNLSAYPENGYYKEQAVSVETAIMLYTQASAYASFDENCKGKLLPGYMADLVILDQDIFTLGVEDMKSMEKLKDAKVLLTMVDGQIAYKMM